VTSELSKHKIFKEVPIEQVEISDEFWSEKLQVNSETAIFHQWEMLEKSGTIDNFRIVKGDIDKFREGLVYVDSDAHKWAEAAATILLTYDSRILHKTLKEYLELLKSVQEEDGYIFTYNQFHFPKRRWINHQIEHELYTLGHLIEASIVYYQLTDSEEFLNLGKEAANLLVSEFNKAKSKHTPGHPEIEIALIKLYRISKEKKYLDLAKRFIDKRGRFLLFGLRIFRENLSQQKRSEEVSKQQNLYYDAIMTKDQIMSDLSKEGPKDLVLRFFMSAFTGKYLQQNKPIRRQRKPVGHCVRWGYLATAAIMLHQEVEDKKLLSSLQKAWDNMVTKRMYITGGIGSLPLLEGFGRDYELNNRFAYNETCAAISSVFWNWEMLSSTGDAKYADLLEWQLYNAVLVGFAADGKSYFYRNPLEVEETFERKEWYKTACCPSNISRTLGNLAKYLYSYNDHNLWIHQYVGSKTSVQLNEDKETNITLDVKSELPWGGKILINFECKEELDFYLNIRVPSWTRNPEIRVNGELLSTLIMDTRKKVTASGISPYEAFYISLKEKWKKKNTIEIRFPMKTNIHLSHNRVKNNRHNVAFSRGPIIFCFESIDNPNVSIIKESILRSGKVEEYKNDDIIFLKMKNKKNQEIIARPYFSWGNSGKSSMRVWIPYSDNE
jgi:DUF1680 family protein